MIRRLLCRLGRHRLAVEAAPSLTDGRWRPIGPRRSWWLRFTRCGLCRDCGAPIRQERYRFAPCHPDDWNQDAESL